MVGQSIALIHKRPILIPIWNTSWGDRYWRQVSLDHFLGHQGILWLLDFARYGQICRHFLFVLLRWTPVVSWIAKKEEKKFTPFQNCGQEKTFECLQSLQKVSVWYPSIYIDILWRTDRKIIILVCFGWFLNVPFSKKAISQTGPKTNFWLFYVLLQRQSRETMTSVLAGQFILTPTQLVGGGDQTLCLLNRSPTLYPLS